MFLNEKQFMNPFPVGYSSWDEKWRDAFLDPTLPCDADPDPDPSQTKNSLQLLTKFYIVLCFAQFRCKSKV